MIVSRILQIIKYKGINKRKFYIETGLSNGFLDKVKDVGSSKIEQILITYPDISPEWLLTGNGKMTEAVYYEEGLNRNLDCFGEPSTSYDASTYRVKKQQIPLFDVQTSAGIVSLFKDFNQEPIEYLSIPNLPKCDGAIHINGDSMYPVLKSGDIIIYKTMNCTIEHIFWGEMYLITLTTDDLEDFVLTKWVQRSDKGEDWLKLVSENTQYEPKDVHFKNVNGLALIKASIRINATQ